MIILSQNRRDIIDTAGKIVHLYKNEIVCIENGSYSRIIGEYTTSAEARAHFDDLYDSIEGGKRFFRMP